MKARLEFRRYIFLPPGELFYKHPLISLLSPKLKPINLLMGTAKPISIGPREPITPIRILVPTLKTPH